MLGWRQSTYSISHITSAWPRYFLWYNSVGSWAFCQIRNTAGCTFEVGGAENVPGIPGECTTRNFAYLVRGPWQSDSHAINTLGLRPPFCRRYFQVHLRHFLPISVKCVPKVPVYNKQALVQIMTWNQPGDSIEGTLRIGMHAVQPHKIASKPHL